MIPFYLVGLSGFAQMHFRRLLELSRRGELEFAGCLPQGLGADHAQVLEAVQAGVPLFHSLDELIADAGAARHSGRPVLVLPVPIHLHVDLSIRALEAGLNVLCEKPLTADRDEARRLADVERRAPGRVAVGFQHIHHSAVQETKERIVEGRLGGFIRARALALWPRNRAYYGRNNWAGKLRHEGRPVLDSPAQNANAHVLQNMLYLAGAERNTSAEIADVTAEHYRANNIDSTDTQALRARLSATASDGEGELLFLATHACRCNFGPVIDMEFSHGRVLWRMGEGGSIHMRVRSSDGLQPPIDDLQDHVFEEEYAAVLHAFREDAPLTADLSNTVQHVDLITRSFRSYLIREVAQTHRVDTGARAADGGPGTAAVSIRGIEEDAFRAFHERRTFREIGAAWAIDARTE
jgi:predicted dehydrogenase